MANFEAEWGWTPDAKVRKWWKIESEIFLIVLKFFSDATGEQMIEVAYKNRIPFSRFIHNADELIDEFNEDKFRKF